jgi:hypothetical protein
VSLQEDWQGWCDRFDKSHNGILRLFHDRSIWRNILAMLDANPEVARGGFGEYWLGSCYTDSMLIGIRRETGADNDSIGLRRSLNALVSVPRMARRDWFMQYSRHDGNRQPDAWELAERDRAFGIFAAPGAQFIDAARVKHDLDALEDVIRQVNAYTSSNIAHRDDTMGRSRPAVLPVTWGQLDAALDVVGSIHMKYFRLRHPGESLGRLPPLVSPGWVHMFATAWMPEGSDFPVVDVFEPLPEFTPAPEGEAG